MTEGTDASTRPPPSSMTPAGRPEPQSPEPQSAARPPVAPVPETPVARALQELDTLDGLDLAEHPDVYQRVHGELQRALATIDDA